MAEVKTTLPESVFAVDVPNHELLKLAYDAYLANARLASATTKTRGEISGGGKKPYRQKGTGRARTGSIRNPLWRGGGTVFGPLGNENYKKKLSTTAKRTAVRQALTLAKQADKIVIAEISTTGKTKEVAAFLKDNNANRRVLIVVDEKTPELLRATANIENVVLVRATYLTVFHVLNADTIIMSSSAVKAIEAWLGGNA
ncbi:MAG TPA: 50S ribosomal protein L4 [Verrucomicrobiae bacterium]|nr:50S ribosomal protein L4 [Verrucomicrobiae bacterium]